MGHPKSEDHQSQDTSPLYGAPYEPAYLARRFDQIAVSLFLDINRDLKLTPSQYAALGAIADFPNSEQLAISRLIAVDRSTISGVTKRLEAAGLITRSVVKGKMRLNVTPQGQDLLAGVLENARLHSERFLSPLTDRQKGQFLHLLRKVVQENNHESRTPVHSPTKKINQKNEAA